MNDRRKCFTKAWALTALLLGIWACPAQPAQVSGQFNVNIALQSASSPTQPKTGACRSSSLINVGSSVTLICSTDTLAGYPYVVEMTRSGEFIGFPESVSGQGTVVSWRTIPLVDRDYLEMLIGW